MPGLWVADATGTFKQAKAVWVSDANGTFQVAKDVAVSESTGTYHGGTLSTLQGGSSLGLVLTTGDPSWQYMVATFPSQGAGTTYRIKGAGTQTVYGTSTDGSAIRLGPFSPSSNGGFDLEVTKADGTVTRGTTVYQTTDPLPAPTGFALASTPTQTSASMVSNTVPGATSYQLLDMRGPAVVLELAQPGFIVSALTANTRYDFAVRAVYNGIVSGISNHVIFTTPANTGPAAGSYQFNAVSATTYAPAYVSPWRPDSDGLYHGNGSSWGSDRGNQSSWFFYGQDHFASLRGGRVTRCEVYLHRLDDAGTNAGQQYRWILHGWSGRPANPFGDSRALPLYDGASFTRGQSGFQDLPVDWGQSLVDGVWQGIAMGNVPDRYMHHPALATETNQGLIRITIG